MPKFSLPGMGREVKRGWWIGTGLGSAQRWFRVEPGDFDGVDRWVPEASTDFETRDECEIWLLDQLVQLHDEVHRSSDLIAFEI